MPWLEKLSWTLAMLIILFGFVRLWRENSGAGVDLFWWFERSRADFRVDGRRETRKAIANFTIIVDEIVGFALRPSSLQLGDH